MRNGPARGNFSRSRSLNDFNNRFEPGIVERTISALIEKNKQNSKQKNKSIRVLEVGCGEGRVLMELRKLFPTIELHGINKKPWAAMKGQKSLRRTGIYYKIFTRSQIDSVELPKIHFYDAEKIDFKSNYFDLIISQVAIPYIKRKDLFLEEAWRVLKPDGKAFLHPDSIRKDYPDFMQHVMPRFIIYDGCQPVPFGEFIAKIKKKGYDISFSSRPKGDDTMKYALIMRKNTSKPLRLNLEFDELSSFDLTPLQPKAKDAHESLQGRYHDIFWGYRSVFRLK